MAVVVAAEYSCMTFRALTHKSIQSTKIEKSMINTMGINRANKHQPIHFFLAHHWFVLSACVCAMCSRLHMRNEKILIYENQAGTESNGKYSSIFHQQQQQKIGSQPAVPNPNVMHEQFHYSERVLPCNCFVVVMFVIQFACTHAPITFGGFSVILLRLRSRRVPARTICWRWN